MEMGFYLPILSVAFFPVVSHFYKFSSVMSPGFQCCKVETVSNIVNWEIHTYLKGFWGFLTSPNLQRMEYLAHHVKDRVVKLLRLFSHYI